MIRAAACIGEGTAFASPSILVCGRKRKYTLIVLYGQDAGLRQPMHQGAPLFSLTEVPPLLSLNFLMPWEERLMHGCSRSRHLAHHI